MSDFHQQAIEDVADHFGYRTDYAAYCLRTDKPLSDEDYAFRYAVAQRERVLELEAELRQWRGCGWAQTSSNSLAASEKAKP